MNSRASALSMAKRETGFFIGNGELGQLVAVDPVHRSDEVPPFEGASLLSFLAHLHLAFPNNKNLFQGLVLLHQDAVTS